MDENRKADHASESLADVDLIESRTTDLEGLSVRRVLPMRRRRKVGPFVFLDHMGPAEFPPGDSINVKPHPHIGLATITYLFEGQMMHRDSLGVEQLIEPGAVNLMVAGAGVTHSERPGLDVDEVSLLHGMQSWIALPVEEEGCAPDFVHYPVSDLPAVELHQARGRVIMGSVFGVTSPVKTFSPTLYAELEMDCGATVSVEQDYDEIAVYVVSGAICSDGLDVPAGSMLAWNEATQPVFSCDEGTRLMILGGASIGPRFIEWNFVSSSRELIEQAKADWRERRFPNVSGDDDYTPLPE